jgi:oligopeptide/dipeptide ABC transporter ATP-binding protein
MATETTTTPALAGVTGAPLLEVADLSVRVRESGVELLRGMDLAISEGGRVGIVGESGSGKSMTASAILGLLPAGVQVAGGSVKLRGRELLGQPERELRRVRGSSISLVSQNAVASLNPLMRVGDQVANVCRVHTGASRKEAQRRAVEMLDELGIPDADERARSYPHHFSGGMAQRVAIAMALICSPALIIADEPTTGLDTTIQAQVLAVMDRLIDETGAALLLISHDLSVIRAMCDTIAVAYAGSMLEYGPAAAVLNTPLSPYTSGLIRCMEPPPGEIAFIPGRLPEPGSVGPGCPFAPRCEVATDACRASAPALRELRPGQWAACHHE